MGIYDRDYSRGSPGAGGYRAGALPAWSVTTWLVAINVAVFVLDLLVGGLLSRLGYFSAATALYFLQVWRFLTFQFLHANVQHIVFNMFSLYFFGPMIEQYLGPRRFLAFYLLCGVAGAVMYLLLWQLGVLIYSPWTPLVGASAGIFGVLLAAAAVAPNARVMLLFPPVPIKLRTMAWVLIGIALATILYAYSRGDGRANAGGEAAHLGGAALGAVLIRRPGWLNFADRLTGGGGRRRRGFFDQ